jgi:magnesium-transporting ATPase (P-type)
MSDYNPSSILPAGPPPSGKTWPPFMGMLSILTVVFPILFACIYCLVIYSFISQTGFNADRVTDAELVNMGLGTIALVCGTLIISIVGMVIGLGALFGKTANKILGIIGLVLNGLVILAMLCGFVILFA